MRANNAATPDSNSAAGKFSAASLEERVRAFEEAWRRERRPSLEGFLAGTPDTDSELLQELIAVDLEFRWREAHAKHTPALGTKLETYVKLFPQLGSVDELPVWLIAEEYRVRRRWGDGPAPAGFLARFPRHGAELAAALAVVDHDLSQEGAATAPTPPPVVAFPAEPVDPAAPLFHGDYFLRRLIGSGGMCKVYTGVQRSLDKPVAVKALKKAALADPYCVHRFLREARIAARLRHPFIVAVHGLGRFPDGGYFMVMDLIDGEDLACRVARGAVPLEAIARWMAEAADAVAFCHATGVVHCDLKPGNLMVDSRGHVHLTDFGLAVTRDTQHDAAHDAGRVAGTAAFMAPEQVDRRWGEIGPATDVYGLGGVLYALLSGRPPMMGADRDEVLDRVASADYLPPPLPGRSDLAERLGVICLRCLAKKPAQRFDAASSLADALRATLPF